MRFSFQEGPAVNGQAKFPLVEHALGFAAPFYI
jgi:hypothetical protein